MIALLILLGMMAGYLMMNAAMVKVKKHNEANALRVDVGLPTKTILRRERK